MFIPSFTVPEVLEVAEGALERRLVNGTSDTLELGSNPAILLDIWLILYSISQFLLIVLLVTLLLRKRYAGGRGHTLLNFLFTMLINTFVFCILFYAGQEMNPNPPTGLCLAQATIKHGSGIMTQVAVLSLAIHVFLSTRASINAHNNSRWTVGLLLGAPYLAFLGGAIPVAVMGMMYPQNIERVEHLYYCSYNNALYGDLLTVIGIAIIFAAAGIQARTVVILHRSWRAVQKLRVTGAIDVSLIIRICVLIAVQIVLIILTLASVLNGGIVSDWVVSVYEALLPMFAFAIFGLRRNVLEMWCCCLMPPRPNFIQSASSSAYSGPARFKSSTVASSEVTV